MSTLRTGAWQVSENQKLKEQLEKLKNAIMSKKGGTTSLDAGSSKISPADSSLSSGGPLQRCAHASCQSIPFVHVVMHVLPCVRVVLCAQPVVCMSDSMMAAMCVRPYWCVAVCAWNSARCGVHGRYRSHYTCAVRCVPCAACLL
jgi:hypothetical protein